MRRCLTIAIVVLLAGAAGYALGQRSVDGFEFTVEVSEDGVHLVSTDGSSWGAASYCGEDPRSFSFVVDERGVRSPDGSR